MAAEIKKEIAPEIAHILFVDIVGYSKLSINEQRAAIDELNEVVRNSEELQKAEAAGRLIKIPTGDGMALVFYASPEAPAQCAMEISRVLKEHPRLQLRMGVHSGPVSGVIDVNGHANLAGAGLNVAQRVMSCGDAGHILLSKRVADDLAEYEHWRPLLHDLGECEVKHGVHVSIVNLHADEVGNPQLPKKLQALKKHRARMRWTAITAAFLALTVIVAGIAMFSGNRVGSTSSAPEKSVAVLPFENLSRDPDNAYFADGIQDEILTRLSKIADLKVISRTSTQHYKSAPENLPEIGKQLRVAHVVEGSVQKSGDAVRVNVQLIKAANDSHLWAETFDRKVTDVFSAETEIAKTIADQLRAKVTGHEEQVIAAKPTEVPEAYDAYLRAVSFFVRGGNIPANVLPAQRQLREAVRLDPKFAIAWALLCRVDAAGYISGTMEKTLALREEARRAAETALSLQPQLGEAVYAKGYYQYAVLKDYDTALRYFHQAQELLPNASQIPEALAVNGLGRFDEAIAKTRKAVELDPLNPFFQMSLSFYQYWARRYDDAIPQARKTLAMDPNSAISHVLLGLSFLKKGDTAGAIAELQKSKAPDPGAWYQGFLGYAYAISGEHAKAEEALHELEQLAKRQYVSPTAFATIYLGLGQKEKCLDWLEKSYEQQDSACWYLKIDQIYDSVRNEPRFQALIQKVFGSNL